MFEYEYFEYLQDLNGSYAMLVVFVVILIVFNFLLLI